MLFWNESGYFDTAAETKPLLHLWSLGIEEQFYIFWPFIVWLTWRLRINNLLMVMVILAGSFILDIVEINSRPVATFYSPLSRCWELLFGSAIAWLMVYKSNILSNVEQKTNKLLGISSSDKRFCDLIAFIGLLLILVGVSQLTKAFAYPGAWALIPVVGACCVIVAGPQAWINRNMLANRWLVWVGLISYPLYLWHWPLLAFARILEGDLPTRSIRIASVGIAFLLASLTYVLIEKPIRYGVKNSPLKTKMLVVAMALTACVGLFTFWNSGIPNRAIAKQLHDFEYKIGALDGYKPCDDPLLLADGVEFNFCLVNPLRQPTAALIGDSHAEDKFFGLVKNDDKNEWTLLANASCPPVVGIDVEGDVKYCRKKFENILNYLAHKPEIETVALSFSATIF